MLGENIITSLTDNLKSARLCNILYEEKRDWLLRHNEWKFAIERTNIAPDSASPDHEWTNQFSLPTDCIRFLSLYPEDTPYRIEGNKLLSEETVLYIRYIKRVTDPNEMDASFREVLSTLIAKELALSLTGSSGKQKAMEDMFEVKLSDARFQGSIEDYSQRLEADDWEEQRL